MAGLKGDVLTPASEQQATAKMDGSDGAGVGHAEGIGEGLIYRNGGREKNFAMGQAARRGVREADGALTECAGAGVSATRRLGLEVRSFSASRM